MHSRRIFLKSIAPAAAIAIAIPKTSEANQDLCQFHADGLVEAMKAKHGGDWRVNMDGAGKFCFMFRLPER